MKIILLPHLGMAIERPNIVFIMADNLAAGRVPEELIETHAMLKSKLDERVEETKRFDIIVNKRKKELAAARRE
jgi:hypothetical protein